MKLDEKAMSADERYIRAGLADGSLVGVGASAIRPLLDEIDRLRALGPGSTGEAEGWVLVPKEPTEATIEAMRVAYRSTRRAGVCGMTIDAQFRAEYAPELAAYRAMLAAAGGR